MPEDLHESPGGPRAAVGDAPGATFRDFLRRKAEAFGIRDRHRRRDEWLAAIVRLLDSILEWLRQSDPEGLLDTESYLIARTEPSLGFYQARVLKIHLGAIEVEVRPIGREVPSFTVRGTSGTSAGFAGRVDLTDGMRKYNLYREIRDGEDHWLVRDERDQFTELDRERFEQILQDLLS